MPKFDLHVATEPMVSTSVETALLALGLYHDELLERHVNFHGNVAFSACPLIGLHMTKKYDDLSAAEAPVQLANDLEAVRILLEKHGAIGYAHGEVTNDNCDVTIIGEGICSELPLWPVKKFEPAHSILNKKWDIHVAIPTDALTDNITRVMEASGMYSIDLAKTRSGQRKIFRIYTIQGVSSPVDGARLFRVLSTWFRQAGIARVEIKQETYTGMVRVGETAIVPPTINRVEFIEVLAPQLLTVLGRV